jgi:hypothetical protein
MATVNNFIKAATAAYNKAEPEAYLHNNDANVSHGDLKVLIKKGGAGAIPGYNKYIESLISVHKESDEILNWKDFIDQPEPGLPARQSMNQDLAEKAHMTYKPGIVDKLLGQSKRKAKALLKKAEQAKRMDDLIYNATLKEFKNNQQNWTKIQLIIKGINAADPAAYKDAIDFFDPFRHVSRFGCSLQCEAFSERLVVNLYVNLNEVVPDYIVCQAAWGKVVRSKMPMPKFHELCHDHICGSVLKVGKEAIALLPVKLVFVNVYSSLPDTSTGYTENKMILWIKFNPSDLVKVDSKTTNGSNYLANFPHKIDFSLNRGFSPIQVSEN